MEKATRKAKKTRTQGVRFQPRDAQILTAIHENDGVLARRHIQALFWKDKSKRAMERRLSKLHAAGYIAWPTSEDYRTRPVPEPICWLGWRGALVLAGNAGVSVPPPKATNENQLRKLQRALREGGFRWVREPRWSLLAHDLAVVDFKLAALRSLEELPGFTLGRWLAESVFRLEPNRVQVQIKTRDGSTRMLEKGVCPDGYFEVIDQERRQVSDKYRARFLLEMDMSTHDNPSFGREKAAAGAAYIHSRAFRERFESSTGRWLVVTNGGSTRLRNLMKHTRRYVPEKDLGLFYFTTLEKMGSGNLFTAPLWRQVGMPGWQAILSG